MNALKLFGLRRISKDKLITHTVNPDNDGGTTTEFGIDEAEMLWTTSDSEHAELIRKRSLFTMGVPPTDIEVVVLHVQVLSNS